MDTARADAIAARRRLLDEGGWSFRSVDAFRFLPPPAAAVWLGDQVRAGCDASPLAGAGWTLHPVGTPGLVDARWFDAADPAQRRELFDGLPLPGEEAGGAPFAWAHRALVKQGLRLRIGAAADSAAAPLLLQLRHLPREAVEAPLLVVELEPGARCVLIETHERDAAACAQDTVQNLQIHLRLAAGARLQHWRRVQPAAGDRVAHHLHAQVGRGAFYAQAMLAGGSDYHLQRALVALDGDDAHARLASVLLADGSKIERQVRVDHIARRTASQVDVLTLARERAHAVADLHAHVRPAADEADIGQHLAGIPTSGAPRLVMRPQLEIEDDAVQAAHGATWGRLPEEALFLARQRGLDEATALALILQGMAAAVLVRGLDDEALADGVGATTALAEALNRHLATASGGRSDG